MLTNMPRNMNHQSLPSGKGNNRSNLFGAGQFEGEHTQCPLVQSKPETSFRPFPNRPDPFRIEEDRHGSYSKRRRENIKTSAKLLPFLDGAVQ